MLPLGDRWQGTISVEGRGKGQRGSGYARLLCPSVPLLAEKE